MSLQATAPIFVCPQCRTPVRAGDSTCRACGTNLALAAALAERAAPAAASAAAPSPPQRAQQLPRFGEYLVSQSFITPAQLSAGLTRQREAAAVGSRQTIGQILLAMKIITPEQLDVASIQQVKQLQAALEETNHRLEARVAERTQALEAALQQLTELSDLKANFIANISHELRTPLVPLKGFSDLLLNGSLGQLSAAQTEAVATIARSAGRLEGLINALIQFASSVKGRLVITPTLLDVPDLVPALWEYFEPRAVEKGLRLSADLPAGLPLAFADAEKIYWVLYQLLDNAVKFTPSGGTVVFSAAARPASVRLSVADTGPGIPPERLGLIFQAFAQAVDKPETFDGTGLGLALVKRIVEAHDAHVEVDSRPGQGSTFSFELPLAANQ